MATEEWKKENIDKLRKYRRDWYQRNKKHAIKHIKLKIKETKAWLQEYKSTLQCEKCGFNHPAALDFHHINPKEKEGVMQHLIHNRGWRKKRLLTEIAKCKVLCSNCHRIHHWESGTAAKNRT